MKKNIISIILLLAITNLFSTDFVKAQDKQKLGQTGMKFVGISVDAKASGMGNAVTSLFGTSSSMLYNPAGIADIKNNLDVSFGQTEWIANIAYMYGTVAFNPFDADYGVFGLSVIAVDYGDFIGTIRSDTEQGFTEVGNFSPTAMLIGVSYGKMLSQKFAIGANIKYAYQSLGTGVVSYASDGSYNKEDFSTDVFAFDFGLIYRTGFKSLNIGMSITNFSQEIKFIEVGFQLPLLFKLGASMDVLDFLEMKKETHSLIISVDATHPRDYSEQILIGAEYTFMQSFSLRGGYETPSDIGGISLGAGVNVSLSNINLGVDYSWSEAGVFDSIHRFVVKFAF